MWAAFKNKQTAKTKARSSFSENANDKMANLDNFLLKIYLIIAGKIAELYSKHYLLNYFPELLLDRWYLLKSSYITLKFSNKHHMGISNIQFFKFNKLKNSKHLLLVYIGISYTQNDCRFAVYFYVLIFFYTKCMSLNKNFVDF